MGMIDHMGICDAWMRMIKETTTIAKRDFRGKVHKLARNR
jgi:hypothetical protein